MAAKPFTTCKGPCNYEPNYALDCLQSGKAPEVYAEALGGGETITASPISFFAKQIAKQGIKKAVKEVIETQIKTRIKEYLSKNWAKQLLKDGDDIVEILDQEWWEYAIELVPIAGDAYGAYELTKNGQKVWDKIKLLENKAEKLLDAVKNRGKIAEHFAKLGNFQAHHKIPIQILEENGLVQNAVSEGWDINKKINGRILPTGFHTKHPAYTDYISKQISDWQTDLLNKGRNPTNTEFVNFMENVLLPNLDNKIDNALKKWEKSTNKADSLNEFFKSLL